MSERWGSAVGLTGPTYVSEATRPAGVHPAAAGRRCEILGGTELSSNFSVSEDRPAPTVAAAQAVPMSLRPPHVLGVYPVVMINLNLDKWRILQLATMRQCVYLQTPTS